jgi:hypothetical protein
MLDIPSRPNKQDREYSYFCVDQIYFPHSDINECTENLHNCDGNATCVNEPQTFSCHCNQGFTGTGVECEGT